MGGIVVENRFSKKPERRRSTRFLTGFIDKHAECRRWTAMTCDAFECGRDLEERCFIERAREELQGNRQLNWFRPFQTAAVRIAIVRHAIVDFSGESGGHDDGGKAGFGAEVDREARSGASVSV